MSRVLTIVLSETAYAALEHRAQQAAQSPAEAAAAALEQHLSAPNGDQRRGHPPTEEDVQAARQRFERHFGAVDLGYSTGVDNEAIDADLARAYADEHKGS